MRALRKGTWSIAKAGIKGTEIDAIGISYQMHGLVLVDRKMQVLRPSVIWCDSRAVPYGDRAFKSIGGKAMPGTSFEFSRKLYGFQIGMGKRV